MHRRLIEHRLQQLAGLAAPPALQRTGARIAAHALRAARDRRARRDRVAVGLLRFGRVLLQLARRLLLQLLGLLLAASLLLFQFSVESG